MTTAKQPTSAARGRLAGLGLGVGIATALLLPAIVARTHGLPAPLRVSVVLNLVLLYAVLFQRLVLSNLQSRLRTARSIAQTWKETADGNEQHIHFLSDALRRRNAAREGRGPEEAA